MALVSSQAREIDSFGIQALPLAAPYAGRAAGVQSSLRRGAAPAISVGMDQSEGIEWRVSEGITPYEDALAFMELRAAAIREGSAGECVWLVEHPPLFTAGTSADPSELFNPRGFPVFDAGRGGRYTYHGPGQRVGYLMLDLEKRGKDIRRFVQQLEAWVIATLADLGVPAHTAPGRIGIWTGEGQSEAKIGAIGIRVKRWVTLHGFSINVAPDLSHFGGIVPCGISQFGVTSLEALGKQMPMLRVDAALKRNFVSFVSGLSSVDKAT
jgi:lipoyl(octanoyl) transferase